ncbi:Uroplakin-1b [Orchesella cincta]|uniref:Uroplakin-1b n=1 Tax=Orchesella cincta TaxID=48709 RepID=A0A1D2NH76_ORCCI|nr:Uroplakin-1b [Orchesella cincta]
MGKARAFNPIHLIFWVAWLMSMAYWFGTWTYQHNAVDFDDPNFVILDMVMLVVCLSTSLMSIVGCCFLFLNVTNWPCTLAYVIPMGVIVPGLCVFGLIQIQIMNDSIVNMKTATSQVIKYWKEHGQSPSYMSLTEQELKCCGLFGPTDYRGFIYGNYCESEDLDVPYTCCNLTALLPISDHDARRNGRYCPIASKNIFNINASLVTNQTGSNYTEAELEDRSIRCKVVNNITAVLNTPYDSLIYQEGCIRHLIKASSEILDVHYIFLVVFAGLCLIMTGFMLKDLCRIYDDGSLAEGDNPNAILIVETATQLPAGADKKVV